MSFAYCLFGFGDHQYCITENSSLVTLYRDESIYLVVLGQPLEVSFSVGSDSEYALPALSDSLWVKLGLPLCVHVRFALRLRLNRYMD